MEKIGLSIFAMELNEVIGLSTYVRKLQGTVGLSMVGVIMEVVNGTISIKEENMEMPGVETPTQRWNGVG